MTPFLEHGLVTIAFLGLALHFALLTPSLTVHQAGRAAPSPLAVEIDLLTVQIVAHLHSRLYVND
jgi:hypothetical protein